MNQVFRRFLAWTLGVGMALVIIFIAWVTTRAPAADVSFVWVLVVWNDYVTLDRGVTIYAVYQSEADGVPRDREDNRPI